jgi:hypothetical protein
MRRMLDEYDTVGEYMVIELSLGWDMYRKTLKREMAAFCGTYT